MAGLGLLVSSPLTAATMKHVVLVGDSVFDNAAYVGGRPDVRTQLESALGGGRATMLARDGAVMRDAVDQLGRVPTDATHLVVSAGGNDALRESGVLEERAASVAGALDRLAVIGDRFGQSYGALVAAASARSLPTAVCTIYEPRFPDPLLRRVAATALTVLNDRITRLAFARGFTLIDLRLICDRDEDFANPIEPSERGGEKIARAIAAFAGGAAPSATVIARP